VEKNKILPVEQKRYFMLDYISDGSDMDKIVVEAPADIYIANGIGNIWRVSGIET